MMKNKLLTFSLVVISSCSFAFASVSVSSTVSSSPSCSVASKTISITTTSTDDLLVVSLMHHNYVTTTSVTYNGVPLTLAYSAQVPTHVMEQWYLVNPSVGTYNVTTTTSAPTACITLYASAIAGVNTTGSFFTISTTTDSTSPFDFQFSTPITSGSFIYATINNQSALSLTPVSALLTPVLAINPSNDWQFGMGIAYSSSLSTLATSSLQFTGSNALNTVFGMVLTPSGSGGGGSGGSFSSSQLVTFPASLYSSKLITSPVSTSTYSFTSSSASSTLKQRGLVFMVSTSTAPTITWGGVSMTQLSSTTLGVDKLYMFSLVGASSSVPIVISGVSASSTKYISQSVWSNADLSSNFDDFTVVDDMTRAYIDVSGTISPVLGVSFAYLPTGNYSKMSGNTVFASSSVFLGNYYTCAVYGLFNDCPVGYKADVVSSSNSGVVLGLSMYTRTLVTISSTASSTTSGLTRLGNLGTDVGFSTCFDSGFLDGISCIAKNTVYFVFRLFIPTDEQFIELSSEFRTQAESGRLFYGLFGFMFFLGDLGSTTTPTGTVSEFDITIPTSISNGTYSTTSFPLTIQSGLVPDSVDSMASNFLNPLFAVFAVLIIALFGLKLLH